MLCLLIPKKSNRYCAAFVCVCVCLCVGNGEKTHLFSSYFGGYTPYAWTTKSLTGDSVPESS